MPEEAQSGCLNCSGSAAFCQLGTSPGGLSLPSREESPQAMAREQLPQETADPPSLPLQPSTRRRKQTAVEQSVFFPFPGPQDCQLLCVKPTVWRQK